MSLTATAITASYQGTLPSSVLKPSWKLPDTCDKLMCLWMHRHNCDSQSYFWAHHLAQQLCKMWCSCLYGWTVAHAYFILRTSLSSEPLCQVSDSGCFREENKLASKTDCWKKCCCSTAPVPRRLHCISIIIHTETWPHVKHPNTKQKAERPR